MKTTTSSSDKTNAAVKPSKSARKTKAKTATDNVALVDSLVTPGELARSMQVKQPRVLTSGKAPKKATLDDAKASTAANPDIPKYTAETLPVVPEGATHYEYTNCRAVLTQPVKDITLLIGLKFGAVVFGKADAMGDNFKSLEELAALAAKPERKARVVISDAFPEYVKARADGSRSAMDIASSFLAANPDCKLALKVVRRKVRRIIRLERKANPTSTLKLASARRVATDGIKAKTVRKNARALYDALAVVVFSKESNKWLSANDPKALEQAMTVLRTINANVAVA